jgi:aryl-alcohol dehydrogenase-like predicted oxidoreductase
MPIEYRLLGRTGVRVSSLCLGCMNFGGRTPEEEAIRIIHAALDAGINFLDTANVYSRGVSETIVGKALAGGRRSRVVLATKVHGRMGDGPNDSGNHRLHIFQQVDESLRRLQTDHIDLDQIHRPQADTPIEETLDALTDLVRAGKVRYIGSSTFPAWQLVESYWVSDRRGLARFVCEQPPYHLFDRRVENEVVPACLKYGTAIIPWSPLAGGWLSGKYRQGQPLPAEGRQLRALQNPDDPGVQRRLERIERLVPLAQDAGVPLSQLALAWNMRQPGVTAPIIGPRTMEQLEDNLKAADVQLSEDLLKRIDEVCPRGQAV